MGLWAPFMTSAMTHGQGLGPYSAAVFLTLGALLSCFIWNIYFMKHPAGRGTGKPQRIISCATLRTSSRLIRRIRLGDRNRIQPGGSESDRSRDFLRHRPISSDGGGTLGSFGMERIQRFRFHGKGLSDSDVRFIWIGNFFRGPSQRLRREPSKHQRIASDRIVSDNYAERTVATSNSVLSETIPSTSQLARRIIDAFLFMVQANTCFPARCTSAINTGEINRSCAITYSTGSSRQALNCFTGLADDSQRDRLASPSKIDQYFGKE